MRSINYISSKGSIIKASTIEETKTLAEQKIVSDYETYLKKHRNPRLIITNAPRQYMDVTEIINQMIEYNYNMNKITKSKNMEHIYRNIGKNIQNIVRK